MGTAASGDAKNWLTEDFEAGANWYFSRAWRGVFVVMGGLFLVLLFFNILSDNLAGRTIVVSGIKAVFPDAPYRVVFRREWIIPVVVLVVLTIANRVIGYMVLQRGDSLKEKTRIFEFFLYTGEVISIIAWKYSGGVESPMCAYFIGHIVTLGTVATRRTVGKHVAFIGVILAAAASAEYTGLIRHTDLLFPQPYFYRMPGYVYIMTMSVIGCMVYVTVSLSTMFRKFDERRRAWDAAVEEKKRAEKYLDLMSHDITNCNQIILTGLGIMEMKGGDEEQKKYIEKCKGQAMRIESLIEGVARLSDNGGKDKKK